MKEFKVIQTKETNYKVEDLVQENINKIYKGGEK
jgi:hypothetical protein